MGNRLSKIVTRTGDAGTTGLGDGSRVTKDCLRIDAIGEVDELNSTIGVILSEELPQAIRDALLGIQHDLFDLGGELCIPGYSAIIIKDVIADAFLQQILLRPAEYDVIATTNLNGDYISDALAAQVGGIGIAPGANISDQYACFEATHGTAPKYAGKDYVNPGSLILSAEMMLRHLGWFEAADLIVKSMEAAIADKVVTYDFARLMEGATEVSCSGFGNAMIERM